MTSQICQLSIPRLALKDGRLNSTDLRLLLLVIDQTDDKGVLVMPQRELAEQAGLSTRAVQRNLNNLKEAGYIAWVSGKGQKPNIITLSWLSNGVIRFEDDEGSAHLVGKLDELSNRLDDLDESVHHVLDEVRRDGLPEPNDANQHLLKRIDFLSAAVSTMRQTLADDLEVRRTRAMLKASVGGLSEAMSTDELKRRLFSASAVLVQTTSYQQITLEALIDEAEVSRVQVDGLFESAQHVVCEAFRRLCFELDEVFDVALTGDLHVDFGSVTKGYWDFWQKHPYFWLYLLEAMRHPEMKEPFMEASTHTLTHLFALYERYRDVLYLPDDPDDLALDVVSGVFFGPVIARALWARMGLARQVFHHEEHLERFINGFARPSRE